MHGPDATSSNISTEFLYRTQHELGLLSLIASLVPAAMAFFMAGVLLAGVVVAALVSAIVICRYHHQRTANPRSYVQQRHPLLPLHPPRPRLRRVQVPLSHSSCRSARLQFMTALAGWCRCST